MAIVAMGDIVDASVHPKPHYEGKSALPEDFTETEWGMTNFDHSIDEEFDETLRSGKFFGRHAAWNFNGRVWFADGLFHEEVWVYGSPRGILSATTLPELMELVNGKYGTD